MIDKIAIGTQLNEDYFPLLDMIDQLAIERNMSRSGVLKEILCEYFEFTPARKAYTYSTMKNLMTEIA